MNTRSDVRVEPIVGRYLNFDLLGKCLPDSCRLSFMLSAVAYRALAVRDQVEVLLRGCVISPNHIVVLAERQDGVLKNSTE